MEKKGTRHVAVYCASREGIHPSFAESAYKVGEALGKAGWHIVWGGCHLSSMGALARGAQAAGAEVHGVVLPSLIERGYHYTEATSLEEQKTLPARIARMSERVDAFVVLPGGIGTLEEMICAISAHYLEQHYGKPVRPVAVLNQHGIFSPLLDLFARFEKHGMIRPAFHELFKFVETPEAIVEYLSASLGLK